MSPPVRPGRRRRHDPLLSSPLATARPHPGPASLRRGRGVRPPVAALLEEAEESASHGGEPG